MYLKLTIALLGMLVTSCSTSVPLFKASKPLQYRSYDIPSSNAFLPREYRDVVDSTLISNDYIDRKLELVIPDTLPDSTLFSPDAPVFDPIVVGLDSGVLISERDLAFYIRDRELVKSLTVEINERKKVHVEIIKGAIAADSLYRGTITEANAYNKQVFDAYVEEKSNKETWRNISLFVLAFGGGYIINEYVHEFK